MIPLIALNTFISGRSKKNIEPLYNETLLGQVKLEIKQFPELEKQVSMLRLTKEDLAVALAVQPLVIEHIDKIVHNFYSALSEVEELTEIIERNSSIDRLKVTLRNHIIEMFSGTLDEEFIIKRRTIARVHVRIGLETRWYVCAFQEIMLTLIEIFDTQLVNKKHFNDAVTVLTKLLNLEQQLVLEAYEAENNRIQQVYEDKQKVIKESVEQAAQDIFEYSSQTMESTENLNKQTTEIVELAKKGVTLSGETEQQSLEGKQQIEGYYRNMQLISEQMNRISTEIQELDQNSH